VSTSSRDTSRFNGFLILPSAIGEAPSNRAKPLKQVAQWVEEYRKFWEGSLDRLAEYLEKADKRSRKKGTA